MDDVERLRAELEESKGVIEELTREKENLDAEVEDLLDQINTYFEDFMEKDAEIKELHKIAEDQNKTCESFIETIEFYKKQARQYKCMHESTIKSLGGAMKDMRAELDRKDLLLNFQSYFLASIYRDNMTKAEAITTFIKDNEIPVTEVKQMMEDLDV